MTISDLKGKLDQVPRLSLGHLPTPLEHCEKLSKELGVQLYIKRDDCTGLGFGGNKIRQLEFTLADAIEKDCDCVIQGAASQSNHCRQAAAACARVGLDCYLVLQKDEHSDEGQGNILLDHLFGAKVKFVDVPMGEAILEAKDELAEQLKAEGRRPYVLNPPHALALAAVAFVNAFIEFREQTDELGLDVERLFVCSCGGTGGGMLLGNKALGGQIGITAVAPILWDWPTAERLAEAANLCAETLGIPTRIEPDEISYTDDFIGVGYGIPSKEGMEAMRLLAQTEGTPLDPVYTSKAFAALLSAVRTGEISQGSTIAFWHTGGTPALFAYSSDITALGRSQI